MKTAIIHDYLREYGGAEMVVEDLHNIFPDAPIYVFYLDPKGLGHHYDRMKNWKIISSWYQYFPFAKKFLSASRMIAPFVFSKFDLREYDVVISSSNHHSAKAVKTKPGAIHLSYVHTPPRLLYGYTTSYNYKKHWYIRILAEVANHFLRIIDYKVSQKPTVLIANSKNVQARIKKFYRRDAVVIHPGVDTEQYAKSKKATGEYYLSLNRLSRGKGTEIAVAACTQMGLKLKVAGSGPDSENLKSIAGKTIEFMGHVTEEEKIELLSNAKALIVATEAEDFGITAVEAQAAGTPVIAANSGGYLETVVKGKTGEFFDVPQNLAETKEYVSQKAVASLMEVLKDFNPKKYNEKDCRSQAEEFSKQNFKKQILNLIEKNKPTR